MMQRHFLSACVCAFVFVAAGCGYFKSPEKRVANAEALIAKGEHRQALIELRNAQQDRPDMPMIRLLLAEVALWTGDPAAAERELKTLPADFESVRREDLALRIDLASGRFAEALARIGTPADNAPASSWLYRGLANQGLGKIEDAERDFRAALERDPRLIAAEIGVMEMRAAENDNEEVLARSLALVRDFPESAAAWFARGAMLARASSLLEAQTALERSASLAPKQLDVTKQVSLLVTLAEVQIANRDLEKARTSAASLARVASGSPIAAMVSARILMASGDFATAAVELRRLIQRTPQFAHARFMLGVSLAAQGNLTQANQELTTVVDELPNNMAARQLLAQVRMRLDDPDSALRVLVPALDAAGEDRAVSKLFEAASAQASDRSRSLALIEREYARAPENQGLKLQLASAYLRAQQGAKALALLRSGEAASSDLVYGRLLLAATAQAEGDDAARKKLESMLAARPKDVGLVLLAVQMHVAAREDKLARQRLDVALAANPGNPGLELALARVQLVSGERDAAVATLTRLRERDPKAMEARLMLAQLALARDDAKEAAALVAEAVNGSEAKAEANNSAGLIYLGTARYDAALEHFRAGTAADPTDESLWLNLGRTQLALNQHEAARTSLLRAISLRPNWLPAEGALAFLELQAGNSAAAIKRVDALRTARPHDSGVMILEADVRSAMRQYVEADRALTVAARSQSSLELAAKHYQLRVAGELPKPTEPLESWVEKHSEDLQARAFLAGAYASAGASDKAVQQYEAIVARQPRDPMALNNLAWLYMERGDRRALETARRAVALAPKSPAVADTLGWILVQSGSVTEGLELLAKASESDPRNGDLQYHYAAALAKAGKPAEAQTRIRELLAGTADFSSRAAAQELLNSLSKTQP
jgi:cellulose synthase operon protein C